MYRIKKLINILIGSFFSSEKQNKRFLNLINEQQLEKIIFVCKGNICRSPYAEFKFNSYNNSNVLALSAGIDADNNKMADPSAIKNSHSRGLDISKHKTTNYKDIDTTNSAIFVLEPIHALLIFLKMPTIINLNKIFLLGCFVKNENLSSIPDPYGLDDKYFQKVYDMIDSAVLEVHNMILKLNSINNKE